MDLAIHEGYHVRCWAKGCNEETFFTKEEGYKDEKEIALDILTDSRLKKRWILKLDSTCSDPILYPMCLKHKDEDIYN